MNQNDLNEKIAKLEAFIEKHLEKHPIPGLSVCARQGGEEVFCKQYGVRSSKGDKGDKGGNVSKVDRDTIFGIASMSKGVTCAALAILASEGKLSFDDRVDKYLPTLKIKGVPRESLKLWHLATHTSGLPPLPLLAWSIAWHSSYADSSGTKEKRKAESTSRVAALADIIDYINTGTYPTLGQPGIMSSYSNDSFALLSAIADIAAGEPLEDFLRERVFLPLGMEHTGLYADPLKARELGVVTELFEKDEKKEDGKFTSDDYWDVAPPYRGCGYVLSTASDMAKFYEALCLKKLPGAELLYGSRFAELPDASTSAMGLVKRPFKHSGVVHRIAEHAGGLRGVATKGGFVQGSDGISAAVLTNWGDSSITPILNAIYSILLGYEPDAPHFFWPLPQGQTITEPLAYTGQYHQDERFSDDVVIIERGGKLYRPEEDEDNKGAIKETELLYCDGTRFIASGACPLEQRDTYEFLPDDRGYVTRLRQGSRVYTRVGL